jgi:thiamine-monophosphate kinase
MLSIGVPKKIWKTDFVEKFYEGWFRLAKKFNVELIGGDISKTPDKVVIDSIAAGEVKKGKAVLRSGARVDDLIYVTGNLGGAAGGLKLLEEGFRYHLPEEMWRKKLLLKQVQPLPRTFDGEFLRENNLATSMIDLSDGLSSDLAHVCRESKVGAKIFADKIPLDKNLRGLTKSFDEKLNYALNGGEDFELLFTVNQKKNFQLENELKKRGFFCIGKMTANAEMIELNSGSDAGILLPKGFRHF